jgi:hypothetical protein
MPNSTFRRPPPSTPSQLPASFPSPIFRWRVARCAFVLVSEDPVVPTNCAGPFRVSDTVSKEASHLASSRPLGLHDLTLQGFRKKLRLNNAIAVTDAFLSQLIRRWYSRNGYLGPPNLCQDLFRKFKCNSSNLMKEGPDSAASFMEYPRQHVLIHTGNLLKLQHLARGSNTSGHRHKHSGILVVESPTQQAGSGCKDAVNSADISISRM